MKQQPKKNMAESILARAELFRRGMLFEGVPSFSTADLELPAAPAAEMPGAPAPAAAGPGQEQSGALPAAIPGATDALVAGSVEGNTALETVLGNP
jgi:hypothetical protein